VIWLLWSRGTALRALSAYRSTRRSEDPAQEHAIWKSGSVEQPRLPTMIHGSSPRSQACPCERRGWLSILAQEICDQRLTREARSGATEVDRCENCLSCLKARRGSRSASSARICRRGRVANTWLKLIEGSLWSAIQLPPMPQIPGRRLATPRSRLGMPGALV